jgi:arabinogalactan endo-1,4-beta-galactosidase
MAMRTKPRIDIGICLVCLLAILFSVAPFSTADELRQAPGTFFAGADISALPDMEKAGAVYRDEQNRPGDALAILRSHGCNLFRVRLFVEPQQNSHNPGGPVQNLDEVLGLARRINSANATFLLDIHYSDTWADPAHQIMPASFAGLHGQQLEQRVHDYTAGVLKTLGENDVMPQMVQVGNEITCGFLWPDGLLWKAQGEKEDQQWREFARLLAAGCRAVREASTPTRPIRIVIHADGGGGPGSMAFFQKLHATMPIDFDVIGLSFYPAWGNSIDTLKKSLPVLIATYHKDVFLAETSYSWAELPNIHRPAMIWPQTPEGQEEFLKAVTQLCRSQPGGHGIGYAWWFPEAIPIAGHGSWRGGREALFDRGGRLLPAADLMRVTLDGATR